MITIRCIAIDDEPPALEQVREYILNIPYLQLLRTFDNAMDAMSFIKSEAVDLIFLDIQMEHLSGIQFLKLLKDPPRIILTTAYDSYALQAFDLEVDDYLLKPISFERFLQATEKIYKRLQDGGRTKTEENRAVSASREYFFVKSEFRIQRVAFNDILFIEGMKEYLIIHLEQEKIYTLQSFSEMLSSLPENQFVRVHKSYIISLSRISYIRKNRIYIGEKAIPIGSTYRDAFLRSIQE